jgi:hypothetical protein
VPDKRLYPARDPVIQLSTPPGGHSDSTIVGGANIPPSRFRVVSLQPNPEACFR